MRTGWRASFLVRRVVNRRRWTLPLGFQVVDGGGDVGFVGGVEDALVEVGASMPGGPCCLSGWLFNPARIWG